MMIDDQTYHILNYLYGKDPIDLDDFYEATKCPEAYSDRLYYDKVISREGLYYEGQHLVYTKFSLTPLGRSYVEEYRNRHKEIDNAIAVTTEAKKANLLARRSIIVSIVAVIISFIAMALSIIIS